MRPTRAIAFAFFLSGAAGLIFEVVWFHRFGLVFGQSLGATSVVLASFMAGLALGTALAGWQGHRAVNLLRAYAALEAVVALSGLGLTYALPSLLLLTPPLAAPAVPHAWITSLSRLAVSFGALLSSDHGHGRDAPC
jgi:predicted membrane-bound spermidine synthase